MKVTIITPEGDAADRDYRDGYTIRVDGKVGASFFDGESEDNTIARNFSDIYNIPELMKRAWEAGKNGESFEVTRETEEW